MDEFVIFFCFSFIFAETVNILLERGIPLLKALGTSVAIVFMLPFIIYAGIFLIAGLMEAIELARRFIKKLFIKIERFEVEFTSNPTSTTSTPIATCKIIFDNGIHLHPNVYFHKKKKRYSCYLPSAEQKDVAKADIFEIYRSDIVRRIIQLMPQQIGIKDAILDSKK